MKLPAEWLLVRGWRPVNENTPSDAKTFEEDGKAYYWATDEGCVAASYMADKFSDQAQTKTLGTIRPFMFEGIPYVCAAITHGPFDQVEFDIWRIMDRETFMKQFSDPVELLCELNKPNPDCESCTEDPEWHWFCGCSRRDSEMGYYHAQPLQLTRASHSRLAAGTYYMAGPPITIATKAEDVATKSQALLF